MSIAQSKTDTSLEMFEIQIDETVQIRQVHVGVKAGFPSPAGDFVFDTIDLNRELIKDPDTTFLARVNGTSMQDMRIYDGDLILVDRSLEAKDGSVAVCYIDGEFTLKRLKIEKENGVVQRVLLCPANDQFSVIEIQPENDFVIWGILTYAITKYI